MATNMFSVIDENLNPEEAMDEMLRCIGYVSDELNRPSLFGPRTAVQRAEAGLFYTFSDVYRLVAAYEECGGDCKQIDEGTLQIGDWVLSDGPGLPTIIIREVHVNCWESGQTIEVFESDEVPDEYQWMLDAPACWELEEEAE